MSPELDKQFPDGRVGRARLLLIETSVGLPLGYDTLVVDAALDSAVVAQKNVPAPAADGRQRDDCFAGLTMETIGRCA